ncbi:MAG: PfkB family carbohydrate kinase, partial [Paludibacter sp.]
MISIIGGTYKEINLENNTDEIYGSGLRSSYYLLENGVKVKFYTSGNSKVEDYLKLYKGTYPNFEFYCEKSENFITFNYYFALDSPTIYPNILKINKTEVITVLEDNIVCFGMLETDYSITGNRVIYDPQTSLRPLKFSLFGKAEQLIYIVNLNEAKSISGLENTNEIIDFFFESEGVYALIIKNGPYGANLYYEGKTHKIPSYITDTVTKIGSGDIYTTSFAYYWIEKGLSLEQSALNASKSTAYFCDTLIVRQHKLLTNFNYIEYEPKQLFDKQIYIASPIFSLSDVILVDKLRNVFLDFGIKVFSPFHDIG